MERADCLVYHAYQLWASMLDFLACLPCKHPFTVATVALAVLQLTMCAGCLAHNAYQLWVAMLANMDFLAFAMSVPYNCGPCCAADNRTRVFYLASTGCKSATPSSASRHA